MRFIAMLRGVNIGSHNRISMAELKAACDKEGFKQVITYLQSGNMVFNSRLQVSSAAAKLRSIISSHFDCDVPVIVKTLKNMNDVVEHNPFIKHKGVDNSKLYFTFLDTVPMQAAIDTIPPQYGGADEWIIKGTTVYLFCPNGYGRTKLTNNYFENKLNVVATTRNLKTVHALLKLGSS